VRAFVDWSEQRNITPFPLISSNLCNYIEFGQEKHSYSTVRRRISALRRINKLLGFEDGTHTEDVYLTIRRAKRSKCLDQKQAVGINHDILVKMIEVQPDTLVGVRNRALLSLGYDFLARRSELVAIRRDDLKFIPDGTLKGMIRKSKTNRCRKGRLVFDSARSTKLFKKWLSQNLSDTASHLYD